MEPNQLKTHPLVAASWKETAAYRQKRIELGIDPESDDIDELEFYVSRVGHAVAHLLAWTEQLQDAPAYLADFNYTGKARKNGITRARYLLYTVENYLIRLQSIYDRCLQLTNCVFHLCVEDSNVGHAIIVSNLHVSRTNIPTLLKKVKKTVVEKQQDRNTIVHHSSYKEKDLDRLQLFYLYDKDSWASDSKVSFESLAHVRSQLLRRVVSEKRKEFQEINDALFVALGELLSGLYVQYQKETKKISAHLK
jgi:Cthe_2314-like HEPN